MKRNENKRKGSKKFLSMLLLAAVLLLCAQGVYAAKNKATTIRLAKTEGDVTIKNSSKKTLTQKTDMRLYDGDHQITEEKSYAWMSLDDTKAVKLDEDSESELRKKGRKLEVLLDSGDLYFNVSVPLEKEESLNIRTSTMVTGVRGTTGWLEVSDDWSTRVYLLTGALECVVTNPIDDQSETTTIKPGTYADFFVFPKAADASKNQGEESCRIEAGNFGKEDIPGFVLVELVGDDKLIQKIYDESGIDLRGLTGGEANARLEQDQQAHAQELAQIEEGGSEEINVVSIDPVWTDGGEIVNGQKGIVYLTMPQKAATVQKYLDKSHVKKVILLPCDGSVDDNTLKVDIDFKVATGKILEAKSKVAVKVLNANSFTVDGTAELGDSLTNEGKLVVNSKNTLRIAGKFENGGTFENTKNGRVVLSKGMQTSGEFTNAGVIEPAENVSGTSFIKVTGGTFRMTGGEIISGKYDAIVEVTSGANATLSLSGGVIANEKDDAATIRVSAGSFKVDALGTDVAGITDTLLGKGVNLEQYGAASVYRRDKRYHLIALDSVDSYPILLSNDMVHGTIIIPDRVEEGTSVTLIPKPDAGYQLEYIYANYFNGEGLPLGESVQMNSNYTFTMPQHDLIIGATFVQVQNPTADQSYQVNVGTFNGGSVTANKNEAKAGEEVVLIVTANSGWTLDSLGVTAEDGSSVGLEKKGNGYAFIMPASHVTVTATFNETPVDTRKTFTVLWKDEDGKLLEKDENVLAGTMPKYNGATPVKASTVQYDYKFSGWSPAVVEVSKDITYVATYSATLRKYDVTWKNEDGTVLKMDKGVAYGTVPTFGGTEPTKPSTAQYSYSFAGWTDGKKQYAKGNALPKIEGNVTFTAYYKQTARQYAITFYDENGSTVLQTQVGEYGKSIKYSGNTPTKPASTSYTYEFDYWIRLSDNSQHSLKEALTISMDEGYKAHYKAVTKTYTITWKNADGKTLKTDTGVKHGTVPSYSGSTPTMDDAQYTYTFAGWKVGSAKYPTGTALPAVTSDVTITAYYDMVVKKYTVTWKNYDGTTLETDKNVPYGTAPSYDVGKDPARPSDAASVYTFDGWTYNGTTYSAGSLPKVSGNMTFTAHFAEETRKYLIRFVDENGNVLYSKEFKYGNRPTYGGSTPTKASSTSYDYQFDGWTDSAGNKYGAGAQLAKVKGEETYAVVFKAVKKTFTYTFYDENGSTVLHTMTVEAKATPNYNGSTPTKKSSNTKVYTFDYWICTADNAHYTSSLPMGTQNLSFKAHYSEATRYYTVTWKNYDNSTIETQSVEYNATVAKGRPGNVPLPGQNDGIDYYRFAGWRDDKGNLHEVTVGGTTAMVQITVTRDIVLKAEFTAVMRTYTVKVCNDDGSVISAYTVTHGDTFTLPSPPADSAMYYGMGWAFMYWYPYYGDGSQWSAGQSITVTSDLEIRAYFEMVNFIGP